MLKFFCDLCGKEIPSKGEVGSDAKLFMPGGKIEEVVLCHECSWSLAGWVRERLKEVKKRKS